MILFWFLVFNNGLIYWATAFPELVCVNGASRKYIPALDAYFDINVCLVFIFDPYRIGRGIFQVAISSTRTTVFFNDCSFRYIETSDYVRLSSNIPKRQR